MTYCDVRRGENSGQKRDMSNIFGTVPPVSGQLATMFPCCAALYAAAAVACLCLHYTYLSYMTDCYFVYVILPECCS